MGAMNRVLITVGLTWLSASVLAYEGTSFESLRAALLSDPYSEVPTYEVGRHLFGPKGDKEDNRLRQAATRTLTVPDDLIEFPQGQKIFQPNGICFTGRWRITEPSSYSGYFAQGSEALVVVRASVSLGNTRAGKRRAFAIAGKLFPTTDPTRVVRTANFFVMDSLVGTKEAHFTNAVLDNHPTAKGLPGSLGDLPHSFRD